MDLNLDNFDIAYIISQQSRSEEIQDLDLYLNVQLR